MTTLDGRVAIVTGGGEGIGAAIAFYLAREGARVAIADIDEEAGLESVERIEAASGTALFLHTDVADEKSVQEMLVESVRRLGPVRYLVNNAGIGSHGSIYTQETAEWDRVLAVNLRGPYLCAKYAAPHMRDAGGGAIVNIASTRALMSEANTEPYSASKGGIVALTHALAVSLGPDRIRVNAVSPGWIETSRWRKRALRRDPELRPEDHAQHPAGRVGRPEDVAEACRFLLADEAGFITGQNFVVDGGMTVKMIYEP